MKKREEKQGRSRNWLSVFAPFVFANKICRTGEKKVQEPVERVTKTQRKEKARNRRKYRTKGKRFETDKQRPSNHHAFQCCCNFFVSLHLQVCSLHLLHAFVFFVFALFKWILIHLNSNVVSLHAFYFVCTVQVN